MRSDPNATPFELPSGCAQAEGWLRSVWLRPWTGADADLPEWDVMSAASRTTAILARCLTLGGGAPAEEDFVRGLTAGDREALLIQLWRITFGERLDCELTCPHCREKMELELRIGDFLLPPYGYSGSSHVRRVAEGDGSSYVVRFRLPTGGDQEALAAQALRDPVAAARELLGRCIESVDGTNVKAVPNAVLQALPKAMAELDPQAELMLNAACTSCREHFEAMLDVASIVHEEIERVWARRYREVHRLASHYHWSEPDILAMSAAKRRRYLGMLREELDNQRSLEW